jgi:hypothetical protein
MVRTSIRAEASNVDQVIKIIQRIGSCRALAFAHPPMQTLAPHRKHCDQ